MSERSAPLLAARGLTRRFGGLTAVGNVSLDLHPGEVHAVIGTNGAGKSTLINMLSGELPAMIHLYRRPLLDEWAETGVSLEALVTHVIVHEAGHHFGFSDADMHAIEDQAG